MVCSSCGFVSGPKDLICPRCGQGDSGENPAPNWSGYGQTAPLEVEDLGIHWGAALGSWLWCIRHGMIGIGLGFVALIILREVCNAYFFLDHWYWPGILITLFLLGICVRLGLTGYRLAWMHRRYPDGLPEFYDVEARWTQYGALVFAGTVLLIVLMDVHLLHAARMAAAAQEKARREHLYRQYHPNRPLPAGRSITGIAPAPSVPPRPAQTPTVPAQPLATAPPAPTAVRPGSGPSRP